MTSTSVSPFARPNAPTAQRAGPARPGLPALFRVIKHVLAPMCGLSPNARLVCIAIVDRMNSQADDAGRFTAFMSAADIARRTGLCVRTVGAKLNEIDGLDPPLLLRTLGGTTRGYRHRCYAFELVTSPAAFASKRASGRREAARRRTKAHIDSLFTASTTTAEPDSSARRLPPDGVTLDQLTVFWLECEEDLQFDMARLALQEVALRHIGDGAFLAAHEKVLASLVAILQGQEDAAWSINEHYALLVSVLRTVSGRGSFRLPSARPNELESDFTDALARAYRRHHEWLCRVHN